MARKFNGGHISFCKQSTQQEQQEQQQSKISPSQSSVQFKKSKSTTTWIQIIRSAGLDVFVPYLGLKIGL
jgi:hypothetical protein